MKKKVDFFIFLLVIILNLISVLFLKTISNHYFKNQLLFSLFGIFLFLFISISGHNFFFRFSKYIYFLFLILLFLTLFSKPISNTRAWLNFGPFNFQPSEWLKPILCLFIAEEVRKKNLGIIGILFYSTIPVFIIMLQPDFGTAISFVLILIVFIYFQRFSFQLFIVILIFSFLFTIFSWFFILKPYQKQRIYTFLFPSLSQAPTAYQVKQSLIAVGSGRIFGKGFSRATQSQLKFLPAQHTDFIFASIAERTGFIGSIIIILIYASLIFYSLHVANTTSNYEEKIFIYLLMSYFSFHIIYNMGMVVGIFPIIGIPILFLSYGGSALTSSYISFGLISSISLRRYGGYEI